jgi:hypothetical protein
MPERTIQELIGAAAAIIRPVLADYRWYRIDLLPQLIPDDLADAFALVKPAPYTYEPRLLRERARAHLVDGAYQYLYHREGGYEVRRRAGVPQIRRVRPVEQIGLDRSPVMIGWQPAGRPGAAASGYSRPG